jgi:hypothetical protein
LELGWVRFEEGWGQAAKWVNGGARDATNRALVTKPCGIDDVAQMAMVAERERRWLG